MIIICIRRIRLGIAIILFSIINHTIVFAEIIEFPEEELSTETVLPVFDHVQVVKNRTVKIGKRVEFGIGGGLSLLEALYSNIILSGSIAYSFDEIHGINFLAAINMDGLSSMGEDLKAGKGLDGNASFDAGLAPHPQNSYFINYQFSGYYGKMSATKNYIVNISLYGFIGVGMVSFGDSSSVGIDAGVGQKFYLTPRTALRFDLRMLAYNGPNPVSQSLTTGSGDRSSDFFEQTTYFPLYLTGGIQWLF